MLDNRTKLKLLDNWGDRADFLDCYCEVKFIDPLGGWSCYIFAMNPYNQDEISCLVVDRKEVEVCDWSMTELANNYNREGEYPKMDTEFRRIKASVLFNKLSGRL